MLKNLFLQYRSLRQVIDNYICTAEGQRKDLLAVNKQVRSLSSTQAYQDNYTLLLSVPGIGIMVAITFLTQIGDMRRFERLDDLCNYNGLVPTMYGSGDKMQTGKMVHRGRKELKTMLIEASCEAIRKDSALMLKFYELTKTMPKNKDIVRIACKLLGRIRFVLKNQQPYELSVVN